MFVCFVFFVVKSSTVFACAFSLPQQTIKKRSRYDQRRAGGQRDAERRAEERCGGAENDGPDGAHALVEVEDAHDPAHEVARGFDLDDHPADSAETYLAGADQG